MKKVQELHASVTSTKIDLKSRAASTRGVSVLILFSHWETDYQYFSPLLYPPKFEAPLEGL